MLSIHLLKNLVTWIQCHWRRLKERRSFLSLKPRENQRNIKKVVLVEELVVTDGEKDEEEVEIIADNMNMEIKRGLETSPR